MNYDHHQETETTVTSDWFECRTCSYGTNSEDRMESHQDEHLRKNRRDPWADIAPEYRQFFYDSTLEP